MNISNKLYNFRIERGLTQAEMGKIAGVSDKTISAWEAGARCPKVVPYVQNICKYFHLDMLVFIDEATDEYGDKSQPTETDGLTDEQRSLIDLAKSVSPEQAAQVLRVLKAFLGDDQ